MLFCLREIGFRFNILKCKFHIIEVKFFRLVITPNKIKINLKKIVQIKSWIKPKNGKNLKKIKRFLGFINFYRRFIKDFIKIVYFLYNLLIKESSGIWNNKYNKTFERLKEAVIIKLMIIYFDQIKKAFLEYDSSDLAFKKILSQLNDEGWLRFITYLFQNLNFTQKNYIIYNKEILAIIRYFKEWQPKFLSVSENRLILIIINYKIFKYFMIIKQLNRK